MVYLLLGTASVVIIITGLKVSSGILGPIFFALTLTFLFAPILGWLKKVGLPSWAAILVMSLSVLLLFGALILLFSVSIQQLIDKLPVYQEELQKQLVPLQQSLHQLANQWNIPLQTAIPKEWFEGSTIAKASVSFLSGVIESGTSFGLFLFTLLLMLIASERVITKFHKQYSKRSKVAKNFTAWSTNIQRQYLIQTMSNLVSAIVVTIAFFILKIDFALLWGVMAFILAYIPNFGLILSSIPPVVLAFIQYGPQTALITIGAIILLNVLMDNVVTPRFMGKGLEIPTIVVFISFLFWTYIFGLLGAFLALPITLAIRSLLQTNKKTKFFADLLRS